MKKFAFIVFCLLTSLLVAEEHNCEQLSPVYPALVWYGPNEMYVQYLDVIIVVHNWHYANKQDLRPYPNFQCDLVDLELLSTVYDPTKNPENDE